MAARAVTVPFLRFILRSTIPIPPRRRMRCFRKSGASEAKQKRERKQSGEEFEVRVDAGKREQCTSTVKKGVGPGKLCSFSSAVLDLHLIPPVRFLYIPFYFLLLFFSIFFLKKKQPNFLERNLIVIPTPRWKRGGLCWEGEKTEQVFLSRYFCMGPTARRFQIIPNLSSSIHPSIHPSIHTYSMYYHPSHPSHLMASPSSSVDVRPDDAPSAIHPDVASGGDGRVPYHSTCSSPLLESARN
jgi:hypothetical protein